MQFLCRRNDRWLQDSASRGKRTAHGVKGWNSEWGRQDRASGEGEGGLTVPERDGGSWGKPGGNQRRGEPERAGGSRGELEQAHRPCVIGGELKGGVQTPKYQCSRYWCSVECATIFTLQKKHTRCRSQEAHLKDTRRLTPKRGEDAPWEVR